MNDYAVIMTSEDGGVQLRMGVRTQFKGMAHLYALFEWVPRFKDLPATTSVTLDEEKNHAS